MPNCMENISFSIKAVRSDCVNRTDKHDLKDLSRYNGANKINKTEKNR